ncbi:MFS transporter [Actinomadura rubrobrunea]|uniref:MFS transporter n=1 Tax=Actinomadura rubrobrunea TaxID=115335 RepID=A0A9W6PU51_9ACTN|nr:MFS transporter [Actinomadura rubrobrunea]GLW63073.1 MFS transporter [Actinomadura rubrobrunea]
MSGRGERALVPLLAFLGVMAYSLSMAVVSPALPLIQEGLGTSAAGAAWALSAMTLSAAVATPVVGRLGDLLGPRRVLLAVLAVTTAGMVVAATAASLPALLTGRALAGIGGGVFPLAYAIIREVVPPARSGSAVGLMSSMLGVGGAVSWCVAGPVIDHLGWRWLLWLPVFGLLPGWFAAWWIVPEGRRRPVGRIDWWGALLLSAWLAAGLAALSLGAALLAVAAVLAAAWFVVETRTPEPLIDPRLMRARGVWTANAASLLSGFALMGGGVLFPLLVQLPASTGFGFGGSATQAAMLQLPGAVGMSAAGIVAGMLDRRVGSRTILLAGGMLAATGLGLVSVAHDTMWQLYAGGTVRGIGLGFAYAAVANLVVDAVPAAHTGVATGVNTLLRTVGASLGTQVSAVIVTASVPAGGRFPAEWGFALGFAVSAAAMAAVTALALAAPRR